MADWLNAVLAGPCTLTVLRDGETVTDLDAVGAELSIAGGVVALSTPDDEFHTWEVQVNPEFLQTPVKFRLRQYDMTPGPTITIASATAREFLRGSQTASVSLAVPNFAPDPTTFTAFADGVGLVIVEEEEA